MMFMPLSQIAEWLYWRGSPRTKADAKDRSKPDTRAREILSLPVPLRVKPESNWHRRVKKQPEVRVTGMTSGKALSSLAILKSPVEQRRLSLIFASVLKKNDALMYTRVIGSHRNGVRSRGLMRTQSGHFDPPSWKITFGIINEGSRLRKVVRINSKFTPSMKPEPHNTARYFDEHTGEYLPTPSHCDCPDGPFLCSHQTGELLLIRAAQVRPEWGIRDFTMLAEPIKSIQSLPLPVKLVYGEILKEERKLARSLRDVARDIARDHHG